MGGYGSGWHRGRRQTVEEVRHLDVLRFHREGMLRPWSGVWSWSNPDTGERVSSIGCSCARDWVELSYRVTPPGEDLTYRITIEWTPCYFGGDGRPWFRCPNIRCGRRCRFLYSSAKYYVCRTCANLTYRSRQVHRNVSEEARAAGVPAWGTARWDPRRRGPVDRLFYRLARARNPRKIESLRRRIERLEAKREADFKALARMVGGA